jgi:CMP-N-acetylneuraminic acid synthetase
MRLLITVCARGGSKGIPGKNIKLLNGKPLLYYTIKAAQQVQEKWSNVDIVLSTDSLDIIRVAEKYRLNSTYRRPEKLAGDKAGKIETIRDVLLWQENLVQDRYDFILDLDVTSPLRNLQDLTQAFELINNREDAINLFSVSLAKKSPYFNMVEKNENDFFTLVKPPEETVLSRQAAPLVYDLNASFYFYRRVFFDLNINGVITDKSMVYVVPHICFDLDHPLDFEFLSFLIKNQRLGFKL